MGTAEMEIKKSQIVLSLAGHDKGGLFFAVDTAGGKVWLADGKTRKLARPKGKNPSHVRVLADSELPAAEKIRNGFPMTDSEIRRALAVFRAGARHEQGGT
jgi:hypothetical protein